MKFRLTLLVSCLFAASLTYGNDPAPRRIVREPAPAPTVVTKQAAGDDLATAPVALEENHRITLEGTFSKSPAIKIALEGVGPKFRITTPENGLAFEVVVRKAGDKFILEYTLGLQVPIPRQQSVDYRDALLSGRVIVEPGKPVAISTVDDQRLLLGISPVQP